MSAPSDDRRTGPRVGLVADDLTGACDAAVGFVEQGWTAEVLLRADAVATTEGFSVAAVVSGVRAAPAGTARAVTAELASRLLRDGADRLLLKVDSTLRGTAAAQIDGALLAARQRDERAHAVLCPAYPRLGRTVRDGVLLVDGRPAHEGAAGADPVTPIASSEIVALVPRAVLADAPHAEQAPVVARDAGSEEDLERVAAGIWADASSVPVGSGGLAAALAAQRRPPSVAARPEPLAARRVLVVVSSLHPASAAQVEQLRREGAAEVVASSPDRDLTAQRAAEELADRAVRRLLDGGHDALVLVGGDGAAAVLGALQVARLELDRQVLDGCPSGRLAGGPLHGLRFVAKSGGFGAPDALVAIVRALRSTAPLVPSGRNRS